MRQSPRPPPAQIRPAGRVYRLVRLAVHADEHLVRLFLMPLQRALGAVDLDEHVVLAAVADLRSGDRAQRAVLKANDRRAVVVELPARLEMSSDGS